MCKVKAEELPEAEAAVRAEAPELGEWLQQIPGTASDTEQIPKTPGCA